MAREGKANGATAPSEAVELKRLHPALECLLFVAAEPVSPERIAAALGLSTELTVTALEDFRRNYPTEAGLQVVRVAGGYQLRTRPEFAAQVASFLRPAAQKLSRQALETVAIIAYEQPITGPEIEALRGVNSDGVVKTLVERGLIRETGRKDAPGRPILYQTTDQFLEFLGLDDLSELPKLEESVGAAKSEQRDLSI
jgi:segregation and condensation protein B